MIITPRMIRDKLGLEGPMSQADLLYCLGESRPFSLNKVLDEALDMGIIKCKSVKGITSFEPGRYYLTIYYTDWKE